MIKNFTPRLYQQTILGTAAQKNTLVVLPTGLGKTALAFLLAAQRLNNYPNSKILMLAPTKPLCEQHQETFRQHLDLPEEKIVLFTGSIKPEKRAALWKEATIIISTPQGLENDVINRHVRLDEVSLLILDEAHHASGEYAYVWLAQQYEKNCHYPRILGLTASPGSDLMKIKEICHNLAIEKVEVRTEKDPDVMPYVQTINKKWISVEFPPQFKEVRNYLQACKNSKLQEIKNLGQITKDSCTKTELLLLQKELQKTISSGDRDFNSMRSISLLAEALKVEYCLELVETQGITPLYAYLQKLQQESLTSKVKAVKNLVQDSNFKTAVHLTGELVLQDVQHPKLLKLKEIIDQELQQHSNVKIIIFTQYRLSAETIVNNINGKSHIFVGQAKKNGIGFSQKEQKEILQRFRDGDFNILVATSVAEEGLDIPKVDKVIFYEPVPSAIRSIQRRGRTGRLEKGEVTILVTAGTRDEQYRWSSHHKEKRMHHNLELLKKEFSLQKEVKSTLTTFIPQEQVVAVIADHREKGNRIVKELIDKGISVKIAQLESADYLVSGKVGVELKKVPDFVASIIDGRLLDQIRSLKHNFAKSVLIIEGEEDIYAVRNVHANAIKGMLAAIVLDFNVPVLYTKNPQDTASLLAVMAKREQDKGRDFSYHESKPRSLPEQQEYFVSSFPGIGTTHAKNLLHHFGSIKKLVNATAKELTLVEGIGTKTAETILKLVEEKYIKEKK
ncbi:MAG: DEAD/DEAH box helicase [Nanoarchaeota archaeon]|nr:DEAD/DEAH box helicase [Nanoarchaeota archaeon]